ncbi:cupin domain-containing protein [Flammeovirga kamogawensis]|uniref:Cupin n=1 Tax=Flammeovirga kamogawensis TaxID=373891 RepID=A0ABX8H1K2_9BACT|nr:cupin [Flammeovirga kamogawensis]MBB6463948.1 quercetin dioxygenase-like cupin family protein [Flammeovirga kamogawensis]QWG09774.1 cupin [Flammeovirga kamogawensis]TRX65284.1 cupin [Flammeovirga kamogawensis]
MKLADIQNELVFNEKKPLITVLFETHFTKEIRIAMQKGTVMKEHKTSYPIVVQIVKGAIDFGVQGEILDLNEGKILALDGGVPHDLRAKEDSVIRLTLTKNDDTNRVVDVSNIKIA